MKKSALWGTKILRNFWKEKQLGILILEVKCKFNLILAVGEVLKYHKEY